MDFLDELISHELDEDPGKIVLHLLGPPHLTVSGRSVDLAESCKRVLALVGIRGAYVDRRLAAGLLWPAGNDSRAGGSLRTALWRLNAASLPLVVSDKQSIALSPEIAVDLHLVLDWAARVTAERPCPEDLSLDPRDVDALELLPGWYDDWALVERERFRHRVLHAVEALSRQLRYRGLTARAVDAAMSVVSADPLRESAQRVLIEAHLAEGNLAEACRAYQAYRERLWQELRVEPAPELASLVQGARRVGVPRRPGSAVAAR